jgi:hypothetical protein
MEPADYVGKFIFEAYILPAQERGDALVEMQVQRVSRELNYHPNLVRGILGSMKFRNTTGCACSPHKALQTVRRSRLPSNWGKEDRPAHRTSQR